MPALEDPKHEHFANLLLDPDLSIEEAHVQAGFARNRHNAARLARKEHIRTRKEELQARQQVRHDVTIDTITKELDQAAKDAAKDRGHAARVAAIMGKAKLHGLIIDKAKVEQGRLDGMSDDALAEHIERRLEALAERRVDGSGEARGGAGPAPTSEPDRELSPVSEAEGVSRSGQDA
jgi:hypothetical protein